MTDESCLAFLILVGISQDPKSLVLWHSSRHDCTCLWIIACLTCVFCRLVFWKVRFFLLVYHVSLRHTSWQFTKICLQPIMLSLIICHTSGFVVAVSGFGREINSSTTSTFCSFMLFAVYFYQQNQLHVCQTKVFAHFWTFLTWSHQACSSLWYQIVFWTFWITNTLLLLSNRFSTSYVSCVTNLISITTRLVCWNWKPKKTNIFSISLSFLCSNISNHLLVLKNLIFDMFSRLLVISLL